MSSQCTKLRKMEVETVQGSGRRKVAIRADVTKIQNGSVLPTHISLHVHWGGT